MVDEELLVLLVKLRRESVVLLWHPVLVLYIPHLRETPLTAADVDSRTRWRSFRAYVRSGDARRAIAESANVTQTSTKDVVAYVTTLYLNGGVARNRTVRATAVDTVPYPRRRLASLGIIILDGYESITRYLTEQGVVISLRSQTAGATREYLLIDAATLNHNF